MAGQGRGWHHMAFDVHQASPQLTVRRPEGAPRFPEDSSTNQRHSNIYGISLMCACSLSRFRNCSRSFNATPTLPNITLGRAREASDKEAKSPGAPQERPREYSEMRARAPERRRNCPLLCLSTRSRAAPTGPKQKTQQHQSTRIPPQSRLQGP